MLNNHINCHKYNYSIPLSYQSSDAVISLASDRETLRIYNVETSRKQKNEKKPFYKLKHLISNMKIEDISGFIYGSFSTRFWMARIGIN